ncbi:MAG: hypothetical protein IJ106_09665 [Parasporobacterium sp.]|nr:hypothetical protein [Parasporobacterium sp.]
MDFVAYNEILICRKPIRNYVVAGVTVGYEFQIKYPSYRGCYLSCIEDLFFEMDGERLDAVNTFFGLNDKQFTLEELPELFREYWYVNKPATIRVMLPGGIAKGEHTLRVYMKHRVPYTGYFGSYLTLESDRTETLVAE